MVDCMSKGQHSPEGQNGWATDVEVVSASKLWEPAVHISGKELEVRAEQCAQAVGGGRQSQTSKRACAACVGANATASPDVQAAPRSDSGGEPQRPNQPVERVRVSWQIPTCCRSGERPPCHRSALFPLQAWNE